MLVNKKIVIFDMDGTLIDSVGIWNEVDRKLSERLGGQPLSEEALQTRRERMLREFSGRENPYLEYCGFLKSEYDSSLSAEQIYRMRYKISSDFLKNTVDYKENAEQVDPAFEKCRIYACHCLRYKKAKHGCLSSAESEYYEKSNAGSIFYADLYEGRRSEDETGSGNIPAGSSGFLRCAGDVHRIRGFSDRAGGCKKRRD